MRLVCGFHSIVVERPISESSPEFPTGVSDGSASNPGAMFLYFPGAVQGS